MISRWPSVQLLYICLAVYAVYAKYSEVSQGIWSDRLEFSVRPNRNLWDQISSF